MIDWTDENCQVTSHFTVKDCIYLHQWNKLAEDGYDPDKLIRLCQMLETIRAILGCPMNIHSIYRSPEYNKLIGAIPNDVHSMNLAADFDCNPHLTIQEVKDKLEPMLESLGIRMERGTTSWVHIDLHPVIHQRYFNP
jgi:hypothetical protein